MHVEQVFQLNHFWLSYIAWSVCHLNLAMAPYFRIVEKVVCHAKLTTSPLPLGCRQNVNYPDIYHLSFHSKGSRLSWDPQILYITVIGGQKYLTLFSLKIFPIDLWLFPTQGMAIYWRVLEINDNSILWNFQCCI